MQTAADIHNVKSEAEYLAWHIEFCARNRATGLTDVRPHRVESVLTAYINHGRWVVDCECGAGNAVHPEWMIACCGSCGAIHSGIVFPTTDDVAVVVGTSEVIDAAAKLLASGGA